MGSVVVAAANLMDTIDTVYVFLVGIVPLVVVVFCIPWVMLRPVRRKDREPAELP